MEHTFNSHNITDTINSIRQQAEAFTNAIAPNGVMHRANYSLYNAQKEFISEGTLFRNFKSMVKTMHKLQSGSVTLALTTHPKY